MKNSVGFNQHRIRLSGESHSEYAKYLKHYKCHIIFENETIIHGFTYSWALVLRQYMLIDVNNYKRCWIFRPTLNST